MKKQVSISESERFLRFMNSFHENHSDDFKALVLHLISQSDIETVSLQTNVPVSTLYDWQSDWNKKRNPARKR
jgi:transposase-like protein